VVRKNLMFLKHFFRNPEAVGAVTALNSNVAQQLIKHFKKRSKEAPCCILEVGAGTGSITESIFSELSPHDYFDIIEIDSACCSLLKRKFGSNPNVEVICKSILDLKPPHKYDFIISTLPFNSLSPQFVEDTLNHFQNISENGCVVTYVEYMGLGRISLLFSKKGKKNQIRQRRQTLRAYKKKHLFDKNSVLKSFLPCNVYHMKIDHNFLEAKRSF